MDAVELLKSQHREVEKLFKEIEKAEEPEDKEALFEDLADKLAIHARIEEQFFYPAVHEKKTEDMVLEAFVEHTSIKRLLADLLEADAERAQRSTPRSRCSRSRSSTTWRRRRDSCSPAAKKVLEQGRDGRPSPRR